jgi:aspartate/tyrosine/aromatic aminotransferase
MTSPPSGGATFIEIILKEKPLKTQWQHERDHCERRDFIVRIIQMFSMPKYKETTSLNEVGKCCTVRWPGS